MLCLLSEGRCSPPEGQWLDVVGALEQQLKERVDNFLFTISNANLFDISSYTVLRAAPRVPGGLQQLLDWPSVFVFLLFAFVAVSLACSPPEGHRPGVASGLEQQPQERVEAFDVMSLVFKRSSVECNT